MITITLNFPEYTDSFDVEANIVDARRYVALTELEVFKASFECKVIIFTPKSYVKYVGIEDIDNAANEVMDFVRDVAGMDSDSDEDDEMYTIVHDMMHGGYDETEFVPYFETVEDGVQVMHVLKQNSAPNISKLEFVQDLHFDSQIPYHLIKDAVEEFHGY